MINKQAHKASPFVVMDFETGGIDKKKSAISEIAAYAFEGDSLREIDRYETLVKPYGKDYDPKAEAVTGLTKEKLEEEGKDFKIVCQEFGAFLQKANVHNSTTGYKPIIVAHNAGFELGFLQHMQKEGGLAIDKLLHGQTDYHGNFVPSILDTMHLAKMLWAANVRQTKYTLEATMERAGIPLIDAHRAMNDVLPSTDFLKMVIRMLRGGGGVAKEDSEDTTSSFRKEFHFKIKP